MSWFEKFEHALMDIRFLKLESPTGIVKAFFSSSFAAERVMTARICLLKKEE
jgi:hypothetical protein